MPSPGPTTNRRRLPSPSPRPIDVDRAAERMSGAIASTPLARDADLSREFSADVFLKREDLQTTRSYKIRGALNRLLQASGEELASGVSCASAGNHGQGVAWAAAHLGVPGRVYMPLTTSAQKIGRVRALGGEGVEVVLVGDVFDECAAEAAQRSESDGSLFIHPFDDPLVIEGQATVGREIVRDAPRSIDTLFLPIGGGGLASGVASYVKAVSPATRVVGVEPEGARSMRAALDAGRPVTLDTIDGFADGAAVRRVGDLTFELCRTLLDDVVAVPEGRLCSILLRMHNDHGRVFEPAGTLSIGALDDARDAIRGKTVVSLVSGGNGDFRRMEETRERALLYEGLKHYFIVRFPQRAGALQRFAAEVLGPGDDITHFEYSKRTSRELGPAVVGIELRNPSDLAPLMHRMRSLGFFGEYLNDRPTLLHQLI